MTDSTGQYVYAGFWRRFWALVVDAITIHLLLVFLTIVASLALDLAGVTVDARFARMSDAACLSAFYLVMTVFWLAYRIVLESSPLQATIGKLALSIKVM